MNSIPVFSKSALATALLAATLFVPGVLSGQTETVGFPEDWSHHHLIFSQLGTLQEALRRGTADNWWRIAYDPRYFFQQLRSYRAAAAAVDSVPSDRVPSRRAPSPQLERDWNVALGAAGTVGAGNYPAKYTFNGAASCSDSAVFNTSLAGATTQATVMAFTNLYSTGCSSVPSVAWAYNTATGDKVVTSVVLSGAGDQVTFISTDTSSHAWLNVLRSVNGQGTAYNSPGTIHTSTSSGSTYSTCKGTAGQSCLLRMEFAVDGSTQPNDTTSSPFYDYYNDIIYVGDASGYLHKFTGVFLGAPAEAGSPWPVSLTTQALTSPVYDGSTYIFVGSANPGGGHSDGAILYAVTASTGAKHGTSSSLGHGPGIVDAPLVDSSAGQVYVSVGNDGSSSCSSNGCSNVVQFATSFTRGSGAKATVGNGAGSSAGVPMYGGTFDNAYLTSTASSPTGGLWVCGNTGNGSNSQGDPILYKIAITSNVMGTVTAATTLTSAAATCSPVSEIFTNSHDYLFLNVTASGNRSGCTGACVYSFDVTSSVPSNATAGFGSTGGSSGIVVDNSTVSGTVQGAKIYFTPLSNGSPCATGQGCAVQVSQALLL